MCVGVFLRQKTAVNVALLLVVFFAFITMQAVAVDPPDVEWERTFAGSPHEEGHSVQQTTDGGYIIVGTALIKTDGQGNILWQKPYSGECVQQTADEGYVIAGSNNGMVLTKLDVFGTKEWEQIFQEGGRGSANCVLQTADGGYIIAGIAGNVFVVKTDTEGTEEWRQSGTCYYCGRSANSILQANDGCYVICGTLCHWLGYCSACVDKIDQDGSTVPGWGPGCFTGSSSWDAHATSIQQTTDGGYILVGEADRTSQGNPDVYLVKLDTNGEIEWEKYFGREGANDRGYSGLQTSDGGYIAAGYTRLDSNADVYVVKTDAQGSILWEKIIDRSFGDVGRSIQQTADGGYIIAGITYSWKNERWNTDIYLIKLKPEGGIQNMPPVAAFTFSPANPTTADVVQFTDESTYDGEVIVSWTWDFGDGGGSSAQNPARQYGLPGVYNVTLTVTDEGGATDTDEVVVTVEDTGTVTGRVTDASTGEGIAGATVEAEGPLVPLSVKEEVSSPAQAGAPYSTTTDANGDYTLHLPEGNYGMTAAAEGYELGMGGATVTAGGTSEVNFSLVSTADTTPPALVQNFSASDGEDSQSTLHWDDPPDTDLAEVVVRRKAGGYPTDHTDGTLVYQDTSPAPGEDVVYIDTGLTNGETYYYAVFSRDVVGNWNDQVEEGKNADTGTPRVENHPPTAQASDITGQPRTMYPDIFYKVTAKYYDPDGRDDLKWCYLRLDQPSGGKDLTMMWYQDDGHAAPWAGEEGEDYLTTVYTIFDKIEKGYQISWVFRLNDQWPEVENAIDFGVFASDDSDLISDWDYDDTNASFLTDTAPPALIQDFTASDGEDNQCTLHWTNPPNSDLDRVIVKRKTDGYPSGHTDGDTVVTLIDAVPGEYQTRSITDLRNGRIYYYAVFSCNAAGNWNNEVTESKNADTGMPRRPGDGIMEKYAFVLCGSSAVDFRNTSADIKSALLTWWMVDELDYFESWRNTRNDLKSAIEHFCSLPDGDDILVFHYAGHGEEGGGAIDPYLAPNNTVGYIPYNELSEWLWASAEATIVILDTCYSGSAITGTQLHPDYNLRHPNRWILAATTGSEKARLTAWPLFPLEFCFTKAFVEAISWEDISIAGDDELISVFEAFRYADDACNSRWIEFWKQDPQIWPQSPDYIVQPQHEKPKRAGSIFFGVYCPVDITIIDPSGNELSKDKNEIGENAFWIQGDFDNDGEDDFLYKIHAPAVGEYSVQVVPLPSALPTDTFTLLIGSADSVITIAREIQVADIPDEPYKIKVTDEGIEPTSGVVSPARCVNHGPNPVPGEGCIFWLDLPDDTVDATLKILDIDGALLVSIPLDPTTDRYPTAGRWIPEDDLGRLLGTGLYLYLVEIEHTDGTVTYSPVRKLVIQR